MNSGEHVILIGSETLLLGAKIALIIIAQISILHGSGHRFDITLVHHVGYTTVLRSGLMADTSQYVVPKKF